MTVITKPGEA